MGLDIIVAKIVFAFVFLLFLMWIIRPAIEMIGIITCPNCGGFLNTIFFMVIPIGIVFIAIYKIMGLFGSRST